MLKRSPVSVFGPKHLVSLYVDLTIQTELLFRPFLVGPNDCLISGVLLYSTKNGLSNLTFHQQRHKWNDGGKYFTD